MSALSPWLRPLQLLAGGLGVAIVALLVMWLQRPPADVSPTEPDEVTSAQDTKQDLVSNDATPKPPSTGSSGPAAPREASTQKSESAVLYGAARSADGTPIGSGRFSLYRDGKHVVSTPVRTGAYVFAPAVRLASRIRPATSLARFLARD